MELLLTYPAVDASNYPTASLSHICRTDFSQQKSLLHAAPLQDWEEYVLVLSWTVCVSKAYALSELRDADAKPWSTRVVATYSTELGHFFKMAPCWQKGWRQLSVTVISLFDMFEYWNNWNWMTFFLLKVCHISYLLHGKLLFVFNITILQSS